MAFTDFKTLSDVLSHFQISYQEQDFLSESSARPSANFVAELRFNYTVLDAFSSEASRCENIIYPLLREVYKPYSQHYVLWSHRSIRYNDMLSGTPDYLVATRSPLGVKVLGSPIVIAIEAKQDDFERGWAQCLAGLIAIQALNLSHSSQMHDTNVYGLVTNGEIWQFGYLNQRSLIRHLYRLTIDDIDKLFASLDYFFKLALQKEVKAAS